MPKPFFKGDAGNVFKGMFTLLVGAGLARLVGLLSIPILARIYSPEDFGVLALYTAFIAILVPIMTLRYVQAIPLPKTDFIAFNLFSVCFKLIFLFSFILTLVLAIWAKPILGWFDMEPLWSWWWLIVLGASGTALYELFSLWATRKKDYKVIAKTQFTQSIIGNVAKIGLGLLGLKPSGLIIGQFLSQSSGVISFVKSSKDDFKKFLPITRRNKEKFVVKYFQGFFWYRLPSQFLMIFSLQAPVIMMAALFNKEVTGQLSLAMMALSFPVGLVGNAIAKAYYAETAALGKNNILEIKTITTVVQKRLFSLGVPVVVVVVFTAEPLFILIFGDEWETAGTYAAILSPFVLLQLTSSPLVQVLNVVGSQVMFLVINCLRVLGLGLVFYYSSHYSLSENDFLVVMSGYLVFYYLLMTVFIFLLINKVADQC